MSASQKSLSSDIFVLILRLNPPHCKDLFLQWAPQSLCMSPTHSHLPFSEFSLMDKDGALREKGGEETKGGKRSQRFKEDRRCVIRVESSLPSPPTSPFLSSPLLLACAVSCPLSSLTKGKGVIRFRKTERKEFYTGKGFEGAVEEGRMTKGGGGEVRDVEADRIRKGK